MLLPRGQRSPVALCKARPAPTRLMKQWLITCEPFTRLIQLHLLLLAALPCASDNGLDVSVCKPNRLVASMDFDTQVPNGRRAVTGNNEKCCGHKDFGLLETSKWFGMRFEWG